MSRSSLSMYALAAVAALALSGCRDQRAPTGPTDGALSASVTPAEQSGRYIVVFGAERLPADFAQRVANLGGSVEAALDPIGVAAVTGLTEAAAVELAAAGDIRHVEPDVIMALPDDHVEEMTTAELSEVDRDDASIASHGSPTAAAFFSRQWNLRAIAADAAWAAGHLGSPDVTVAILDSGIDYLHPDLEGRVDLARSISLVPSEDARVESLFPGRHPITDLHSHGTATAGLIVSNAHHLAGVTQRTTLFGVKVDDGIRSSPLSVYLEGIMYAADHGADVIQMSFGVRFNKREKPGLMSAVQRVIDYAHRKGAVMVAAAGNTPAAQNTLGRPGDYDHDVDQFRLCNAAHVICVAATGPTSAASEDGPWENVDAVARYSHFGRSAIDVAAPGGGLVPLLGPAVGLPVLCSQAAVVEAPPPVFRCTGENLSVSSAGTSWSAATTSGLAALLVSTVGKGRPAQIEAAIENSADDLGDPGTDARYGKGRVNIARALGLIN